MSEAKPKRTLAPPLVALSILLPLLAACGGSDGSTGGPGAAAGGGSAGAGNDRYVKFARCMRENGVPNFPDPDGRRIRISPGSIDPDSPQFKTASQKCRSLLPPGWGGGSRQDPAVQAQMLKYSQCMRENGVPGFPDPQGGVMPPLNKDEFNPDSPQFKAAERKCESLRAPGGGG